MYELVQVAENTFYMDCPSKVGFFKTGKDEVVLIDSSSDKDAAKKIKKILDANGWSLKAIYNTHSHADHIGGNQYLQAQTGCKIYASSIECSFTKYPILESTCLYGGNSFSELHNKFLKAQESEADLLTQDSLVEGLSVIKLPGHSFDMVGFKTSDNVIFLADCLSSAQTLEKYQIGYLFDVQSYLDTLEMVKTLQADLFIPSHAEAVKDITPLAQLNIDKTLQIIETIKGIVSQKKTFEDILKSVFDTYNLSMSLQQNVLIGSTVRSYLAYLKNKNLIGYSFENNKMIWSLL